MNKNRNCASFNHSLKATLLVVRNAATALKEVFDEEDTRVAPKK